MRDKKLFIASVTFIILFCFALICIFAPCKNIFSPIITAVMLCYFLSPLIKLLEKIKIKRFYAVIIVYVGIFAAIVSILMYATPLIYSAVSDMIKIIDGYFVKIGIELLSPDNLLGGMGQAYNLGLSAIELGTVILVGGTAAFYMLSDMDGIRNACFEFIPEQYTASFMILADDVTSSFNAFFRGQVIVAALLAVIEGVYFSLLGIPGAWVIGILGGILDIIPYIGAFISFLILLVITFISAPQKILWAIIGFFVIQQIENNILSPKISGDSLSLHPATVILILYIGALGGFWGILLSVPLACVLKKILKRLIQSII